MAKDHKDGNRRKLHTSTFVLALIAFLAGMIALEVSYISAWTEREKIQEETSSTDVFARINDEQFDGGTFTADKLQGVKVTMFNVWETTCPACLGEMGALEELSKAYPASNFQLIGICADVYDKDRQLKEDQVEKGKSLMQEAGVSFTNLIPDPELYKFIRSTVIGYPTTFFVDSEGKILMSTCGAKEPDNWKETVDEVLKSLD